MTPSPSPPPIVLKLLNYINKYQYSDFGCTYSCFFLQATVGDREGMFGSGGG